MWFSIFFATWYCVGLYNAVRYFGFSIPMDAWDLLFLILILPLLGPIWFFLRLWEEK